MRLVADDVTVRFSSRDEPVLNGATFAADTGETIAVLGPSGSGKSTLLSVLGGLVPPTSGSAHAEMSDGTRSRSSLGALSSWILQTTNMLPERTALDNVAIAAEIAGQNRHDALDAAITALDSVGLVSRAGEQARLLSGGEVQRIATARALVSGRPFILADEPTGQLDRTSTMGVLDALFAAAGTNTCLVVVTHDPMVADRCDRTVQIENGKVAPR